MEITTSIKIIEGKLAIQNSRTVVAQMEEMGLETYECVIRRPFESHTDEQVAYMFAEVCVKAMMGYRSVGIPCRTKEMAYAKLALEEDIDFTDSHALLTGESFRVPKSARRAPKYELYEFIKNSIMFIEGNFGLEVVSPEEWKKFKHAKEKGKAKRM